MRKKNYNNYYTDIGKVTNRQTVTEFLTGKTEAKLTWAESRAISDRLFDLAWRLKQPMKRSMPATIDKYEKGRCIDFITVRHELDYKTTPRGVVICKIIRHSNWFGRLFGLKPYIFVISTEIFSMSADQRANWYEKLKIMDGVKK